MRKNKMAVDKKEKYIIQKRENKGVVDKEGKYVIQKRKNICNTKAEKHM